MRFLPIFLLFPLLLTAFEAPYNYPRAPKREVIVLDAGHGGEDRGTISLNKPFLLEKRLTLFTTFLVRSALTGLGYQTLMTRLKDESVSLDQRVSFTNEVKPACFVSIHFNSAPSREAQGIEIFIPKEGARVNASDALATAILRKTIEWTGAENRGVKKGNFKVIRETEVPAVLVEGGFLSNPDEAQQIGQPLYLKKLAMGIAKGIDDYLTSKRIPKSSKKPVLSQSSK